MLPRLKSELKGRRFSGATEIVENAAVELKRLPYNGFQECLQHLYSRWQKCIVAQGAYFEGNVV